MTVEEKIKSLGYEPTNVNGTYEQHIYPDKKAVISHIKNVWYGWVEFIKKPIIVNQGDIDQLQIAFNNLKRDLKEINSL